tara:strand:- start:220 stop:801 length:582 start_codon:yes stop_codon:yes gene_type:complete
MGSLEHPLSPAAFALGAGARFVARSIDTLRHHLPVMFTRAHGNQGASFVEILQNCVVYNDGVYEAFTERDVAEDGQVHVEHGQPLLFGKERTRGLRVKPGAFELEAVNVGGKGVAEADVLVHDETNKALASMLAALEPPMPVALGVLYCDPAPSYEEGVMAQIDEARAAAPDPDINAILRGGYTWTVSAHSGD